MRRHLILGLVLAWLTGCAAVLVGVAPASACGGPMDPCADPPSTTPTPGTTQTSSPTVTETYNAPASAPSGSAPAQPALSCSVYANGSGMGSYCVTVGGGTAKTLRERFGGQHLQRCRYRPVPKGIPVPFNAKPGKGRYLLMECLNNIDFDTYDGGPDRTLSINVVWVRRGTDISDHHSQITDFLWSQIHSGAQLPVPFLRTEPNVTPLVGIPTYFTFRWLDPNTDHVVAQGPYAGKPGGGPFKQIRTHGLVMRASAVRIKVDPNQKGIPATTCAPDTPYRPGAAPRDQPAGACSITFPRSSASARKYATAPIPPKVHHAFNATVTVVWKVTYGDGTHMQALGDGFTMRVSQVVPVQEVQAPNQPPSVIY